MSGPCFNQRAARQLQNQNQQVARPRLIRIRLPLLLRFQEGSYLPAQTQLTRLAHLFQTLRLTRPTLEDTNQDQFLRLLPEVDGSTPVLKVRPPQMVPQRHHPSRDNLPTRNHHRS